jgi:hypothetical protein
MHGSAAAGSQPAIPVSPVNQACIGSNSLGEADISDFEILSAVWLTQRRHLLGKMGHTTGRPATLGYGGIAPWLPRRPTGCAELSFWLRCCLRGRSCSWSRERLQLGLTFYCGPPFALSLCHGFASRRADLPPCRFFRCRCQRRLGRFPIKECAEFSYLDVNFSFLLFKAFNGGCDKFVREFWSRHLFLQFVSGTYWGKWAILLEGRLLSSTAVSPAAIPRPAHRSLFKGNSQTLRGPVHVWLTLARYAGTRTNEIRPW